MLCYVVPNSAAAVYKASRTSQKLSNLLSQLNSWLTNGMDIWGSKLLALMQFFHCHEDCNIGFRIFLKFHKVFQVLLLHKINFAMAQPITKFDACSPQHNKHRGQDDHYSFFCMASIMFF